MVETQRKFLFIANGNGEDSIAAGIIRKLPESVRAEAYPMVGAGKAYENLCPIVGPHFAIPSEGWRHTSGSVARDVKGGMLSSIMPAWRFLRSVRGQYEKVIVVGDGVGPLMCWLAGLKIDLYLDVFKSGYAHRYSGFERFLLGRVARTIFCRDEMLAQSLREAGIDGRSAGNIMLDTVPYGTYDMAKRRSNALAVTLLPGSRATVAESLKVQIAALAALPDNMQSDIFVALASGIDPQQLAIETGMIYQPTSGAEETDKGQLTGQGLTLHLVSGAIGNLLKGADLVLSQAGTATQQALGLGKPVITFDRQDNRRKRMDDEQKLMGEARILTEPGIDNLSVAIKRLLENPQERQRLGAIGRERLGGPGTLQAILAELA